MTKASFRVIDTKMIIITIYGTDLYNPASSPPQMIEL